ncbi:transcription antitermination factor NusB [Herbiconiux solani]|uniref:transcription antitermination factor NusB n=1 Tax=Herbiconiux solani TaxID=661329 RepID=UPI0008260C5B|nr:transcription antitermination factor NusB [Herbiconiux solani]
MSARTKARKRALDILYAADVRQIPIQESLAAEAGRAAGEPDRQNSWPYAREIVDGVIENQTEIDETIETYAQGWSIPRMPTIDRALLRIGVWEIQYNDEVPASVAIAEAVELAKTLSTDDSSGFVNGVLGKVALS